MNFNRVLRTLVSKSRTPSGGPHCRWATTLVVAEHDNVNLFPSTLSTIEAAKEIGGDVVVLMMGHNLKGVSEVDIWNVNLPSLYISIDYQTILFISTPQIFFIFNFLFPSSFPSSFSFPFIMKIASKVNGVTKVLSADHEGLKNRVAEDISPVVRDIVTSGSYTHVVAPSSNHGNIFVNSSIL